MFSSEIHSRAPPGCFFIRTVLSRAHRHGHVLVIRANFPFGAGRRHCLSGFRDDILLSRICEDTRKLHRILAPLVLAQAWSDAPRRNAASERLRARLSAALPTAAKARSSVPVPARWAASSSEISATGPVNTGIGTGASTPPAAVRASFAASGDMRAACRRSGGHAARVAASPAYSGDRISGIRTVFPTSLLMFLNNRFSCSLTAGRRKLLPSSRSARSQAFTDWSATPYLMLK